MEMTYEQMVAIIRKHDARDMAFCYSNRWMLLSDFKKMVKAGQVEVLARDYKHEDSHRTWLESIRPKTIEEYFDAISNYEDGLEFYFNFETETVLLLEYRCDNFYGNRDSLDLTWTLKIKEPKKIECLILFMKSRIESIVEDIRDEEKRLAEEKEQERVKKALLAQIS